MFAHDQSTGQCVQVQKTGQLLWQVQTTWACLTAGSSYSTTLLCTAAAQVTNALGPQQH